MRPPVSRRRYVHLFGVSALAALAGCSGGDASSDDGTDGESSTDDTGSTEDGGLDAGSGPDTWEPGRFVRPGHYEVELYQEGLGDGTLVWGVEDVDDESAVISIDYDHGPQQYQSTHTVDQGNLEAALLGTPVWMFLVQTTYAPELHQYADESLEVGASWTFTTADGELRYEITGTDTHAGIDCYVSEVTLDDHLYRETCIAPAHGLALHSAMYDDDGAVVYGQTVVDYSDTAPTGSGSATESWSGLLDWTNLPQTKPGEYQFDVTDAADGDSTLVWDLYEEPGGEYTVAISHAFDDRVFDATVVDENPGGAVLFESDVPDFYSSYGVGGPAFDLLGHHRQSIAVGDEFVDGDARWTVVDAFDAFGVLVFEIDAEDADGELTLQVAPELEAPIYAKRTTSQGSVEYEVELTDFESY